MNGGTSDTGFRRLLLLTLVLSGAFALWTGFELGGAQLAQHVNDLAIDIAVLLATAGCIAAARRTSRETRLFWWLLGAACLAWAVGELTWSVYYLRDGDVPSVSWADAAYLLAVPFAGAALLVHPALRRRAGGRPRTLADGVVLAAALFFLSWSLILEPIRHELDFTSFTGLVTLAYPLTDVVILFLVVLVIRETRDSDRRDLWCLLAGLALITLSDIVYTYIANVQDTQTGNVVDTGWFAGYLAIALGALSARTATQVRPAVETDRTLGPIALVAPFLPVLAALVVVGVHVQLGHVLDRVTLVAAFVLVGVVLVRQALLIVDLLAQRDSVVGGLSGRVVVALSESAPDPRRRGAREGLG